MAYTQKAANMPRAVAWKRGVLVKGNTTIAPGTAIATFDADGRYGNHIDGRSHAAIYLGQDASRIQVLDQWVGSHRDSQGHLVVAPKPVSERTIKFLRASRIENNGDNYYAVE